MAVDSNLLPLGIGFFNRSDSRGILNKKAIEALEHIPDLPKGAPALRVVGGNGEADVLIDFETAVGGHESDIRPFHGILLGEYNNAVIEAVLVAGTLHTLESEVPLIYVVCEGSGVNEVRRICPEVFYFVQNSF